MRRGLAVLLPFLPLALAWQPALDLELARQVVDGAYSRIPLAHGGGALPLEVRVLRGRGASPSPEAAPCGPGSPARRRWWRSWPRGPGTSSGGSRRRRSSPRPSASSPTATSGSTCAFRGSSAWSTGPPTPWGCGSRPRRGKLRPGLPGHLPGRLAGKGGRVHGHPGLLPGPLRKARGPKGPPGGGLPHRVGEGLPLRLHRGPGGLLLSTPKALTAPAWAPLRNPPRPSGPKARGRGPGRAPSSGPG